LPLSWTNVKLLFEEKLGGVNEATTLNERVRSRNYKKEIHNLMLATVVIAIHGWWVSPIWNTMAAIPGHIKDEVVVLGYHRDGQLYD
jgi:N-acetylated-alpha-linked acidic dipeptidase